MTLLTAVNNAQRLLSLPVTATIVADGQETQNLLYALANMEAADVLRREYYWPLLVRTKSFTASLASLQSSGKPTDFAYAVPNTFWNTTSHRQLAGPLKADEWSLANSAPVISATQYYVMYRYDGLHIFPVPASADTITYDYVTNTPVLNTDGVTYQTQFAADTDTYVLSESVLTLGIVWRYKQAKGRDYAEDMRSYEFALAADYEQQRGAGRIIALAPADDEDIAETMPNLPAVFG